MVGRKSTGVHPIRSAREKAGLTQHDLGTSAGIHPNTVYRLERKLPELGRADALSLQAAARLAIVLLGAGQDFRLEDFLPIELNRSYKRALRNL